MSNKGFFMSKLILNNLPKNSIKNFLEEKELFSDYNKARSRKMDYSTYIESLLNAEKLSIHELNEFLFKNLFYGIHKNNYISYIEDIAISNEDKILEVINKNYKKNQPFIDILGNTLRENNDKLVAFQLIKNNNNKIISIQLLYGEIVKMKSKDSIEDAYSYIPVDINLENNVMVVRIAPKTNLENDNHKPTALMEIHMQEVKRIFEVNFKEVDDQLYHTIYEISNTLIDDAYNEMHRNILSDKENDVLELTEKILGILEDIEYPINSLLKERNSIFDIEKNIKSMINNVIVLKKILEDTDINNLGLDGYLTYLKYQDLDEYNITFKGDSSETISFSGTFLRIKNDLDEFRHISDIKVIWYTSEETFESKYRYNDVSTLNIRFYKEIKQGDFEYAFKKFEEFRQRYDESIHSVDKTDVIKTGTES